MSKQLLQDSELHVRRIANQHGLGWDGGMDNTVAAVALQAREDGLSGITHLKAGNGAIRFAQADGFGIREGVLDARVAANTPASDSKEMLGALDARAMIDPVIQGVGARESNAPEMSL